MPGLSGARPSRPPVPVIVVAGFLGSGKTTLLNHLLRTAGASGTRLGVLVNDFGAVNIDALLVSAQADGAVSLGNGCMCCTVDADGLEDALVSLVRPGAGIDAIVIEASGIAEPKALIRMVTAVADPRLRYGGLVYVVDAANIDAVRAEHPEIDSHIAIADLILVNKADLIADDARRRVEALVGQLNPTAAAIPTTQARIDPALLFDVDEAAPDEPRSGQLTLDELLLEEAAESHHEHLHAGYESVSFHSGEPLHPRRLARFLERPPAGCFRIKGIVHFDVPRYRQKFVVHGVGGFIRVERESWEGATPATELVAIGRGMDRDAVLAELEDVVTRSDDPADPNGILSVLRHVPEALDVSQITRHADPDVTLG
ncbi:cobalamin biosynthesis protein CobW [Gordonia paraffinivorans]|uniref:CobW family GTP-binding protein n=1 Tax=Gordonia paraffinivorans TaxID=175628 RepID=UPI000D622C6D|nr:GTP-binding protein [Gordonia paraffinivorans]MBY4574804.1 cobalamin biosynthesis protein CobW [Gordonia paraffinivorans]PWD44568.1 cobalamin biosynthesis protein CobW [Gordonia paraffinivorans]